VRSPRGWTPWEQVMTATLEQRIDLAILHVEGALRAPVNSALSRRVADLLHQGQSHIVLELSLLDQIDAAGVGELVRLFGMTRAAGGVLRLVHANMYIRRILEVTGVWRLLTAAA
jgi:anti-anti-sigma factor